DRWKSLKGLASPHRLHVFIRTEGSCRIGQRIQSGHGPATPLLASRAVAEPLILPAAERRERRPVLGYVMVMTAATLWAVNGAVSKVILTTGLSSLRLAQVRSTGAFVLIAFALAATRPRALRMHPRELPYFVVFGIGGLALVQWFYFLAIHRLE